MTKPHVIRQTDTMNNRPLKAAILNDTSFLNHHGCRHVMNNLRAALQDRGMAVAATSPVAAAWWENSTFLDQLHTCDVIIINGEGTLHHGANAGKQLLEIVNHPAATAIPVALINALYQDNPSDWRIYLDKFTLISARDSTSRQVLAETTDVEIRQTPDISFFDAGFIIPDTQAGQNRLLGIGDSVYKNTRKELQSFYRKHKQRCHYLSIHSDQRYISSAKVSPLHRVSRNLRYKIRSRLQRHLDKNRIIAHDSMGFKRELAKLPAYFTGRYHGIALSLSVGCPVFAATSNSHKIEALITDAGLNPSRILPMDEFDTIWDMKWDFSPDERASLKNYINKGHRQFKQLFDDIQHLAAETQR